MLSRKVSKFRGKFAALFGNMAGAGSIISAHNVCHWLCLVAVAVLSVFGVIVSSNVLMFLEDYNLLFWSIGLVFLGSSLFLYVRTTGCISMKLIVLNIGLLIIGTPFVPQLNIVFWTTGGTIVALISGIYIREKFFIGVRNEK